MPVISADTQGPVDLAAAGDPKTLISLVVGANETAEVLSMRVSFNGTVATENPVLIELILSDQTTAGVGSAATEKVHNQKTGAGTAQIAATFDHTVTSPVGDNEPTTMGDVLRAWDVHPQGGLIDVEFPEGRTFLIKPSQTVNIRATIPSTGTVTAQARAGITWRE